MVDWALLGEVETPLQNILGIIIKYSLGLRASCSPIK